MMQEDRHHSMLTHVQPSPCPKTLCRACYNFAFVAVPEQTIELETKMKCQKIMELKNCCIKYILDVLSEVDIGLDSMIKTEYREKEKAVLAPPAANVPSKELEELECFIVRERKFEQQVKDKKYLKIDTSKSFRHKLTRILNARKAKFCDEIERDHNFAYLLIILGFPLLIFGPLLCMGAASVVAELCDKWELGHLEPSEEYRLARDHDY